MPLLTETGCLGRVHVVAHSALALGDRVLISGLVLADGVFGTFLIQTRACQRAKLDSCGMLSMPIIPSFEDRKRQFSQRKSRDASCITSYPFPIREPNVLGK